VHEARGLYFSATVTTALRWPAEPPDKEHRMMNSITADRESL
jgi:hypothetical protein